MATIIIIPAYVIIIDYIPGYVSCLAQSLVWDHTVTGKVINKSLLPLRKETVICNRLNVNRAIDC